jgi:hypothetical protein
MSDRPASRGVFAKAIALFSSAELGNAIHRASICVKMLVVSNICRSFDTLLV